MALIRTGTARDLTYAAIRNVEGDASTGIVRVNIGLWYDEADRRDGVTGNETMPPARDAKTASLPGLYAALKEGEPYPSIYAAILALPEWAGWSSDEG